MRSLKAGVLVIIIGLLFEMAIKSGEGKAKIKSGTAVPVDASQYIGSEGCITCHEGIGKHFEKTAHVKTRLHKNWTVDKQGCEACHGPGKADVEGGGAKSKIFTFK